MRRHGFTLVEMMVAMALTLFVMVILSQAFIAALDTFSGLKAIGDMDEGLRTTVNSLRGDLLQVHVEDATGAEIRLKNLTAAPAAGFFVIRQGTATTSEGTDLDGLGTARATDHVLHFSVNASQLRLPGGAIVANRPENFFVASVPTGSPLLTNRIDPPGSYPTGNDTPYRTGTTVSSPWAEVAYFLVQQGTTTQPNNPTATGGTTLYKLYRSQFLVVRDNTLLTGVPATTTGYDSLSWITDATSNMQFGTPTNLVVAANRRFLPATPTTTGATILLNNVVSFSVRAMRPGDTDFVDIAAYETTGATPTALTALEITIRVWDAKTQGTRQITIVQDM